MKALINEKISKEFETKTGISVFPLTSYSKLDTPVSSHADMLFCILDKTIFCYEDYVMDNGIFNLLNGSGYDVVFVSNVCKREYPYDISLNVLVIGKFLFCNVKYTAKEILEYAEKNGYSVINVRQGYAACSTLVIDDYNAITTDLSVYKALTKTGKNALLIDNSEIELKGYNCGFIGGSTCIIGNNICFFGDPSTLTDFEKIDVFIRNLNFNILPILQGGVCDFGGVKFIL